MKTINHLAVSNKSAELQGSLVPMTQIEQPSFFVADGYKYCSMALLDWNRAGLRRRTKQPLLRSQDSVRIPALLRGYKRRSLISSSPVIPGSVVSAPAPPAAAD